MKYIFSSCLLFLIFTTIAFFVPKSAYAACSMTPQTVTIHPDFSGEKVFTITGTDSTCIFAQSSRVLIYPSFVDQSSNPTALYASYFMSAPAPSEIDMPIIENNNKQLTVSIDFGGIHTDTQVGQLRKALITDNLDKPWTIKVCKTTLDGCMTPENFYTTSLSISNTAPTPDPTPTYTPSSIAGYCTNDFPGNETAPPLQGENHCSNGYSPVHGAGCECKANGSAGTLNTTDTSIDIPTPLPTLAATPFPCANLDPTTHTCNTVSTAIGDISTDPMQFIKLIFTVLLSMSGGWAVYLIITAGYQLMFSQGDAEGVKEAQEKITSAIVGIVFMLLSFIILRIIGVDIFALPTFK